jgi:hypothetical protein
MTQWLLAALLISLAAVYTIWRLMPATWQFRGLQALERWLAARLSAVRCSSCSSAPTKPEP